MFQESFENGLLSTSMRGALITLLPKLRKPFRPFKFRYKNTLQNSFKKTGGLPASSAGGMGPKRIYSKQTGFNILHVQREVRDTALLSLDAEKASALSV